MYDLQLLSLWEDILNYWHEYRTPLIYVALILLFAIRVGLHTNHNRIKFLHTPDADSKQAIQPLEKRDRFQEDKTDILVHQSLQQKDNLKTKRASPRRVTGSAKRLLEHPTPVDNSEAPTIQLLIFYSSLTSTTEALAKSLHLSISKKYESQEHTKLAFAQPEIFDLSYIDYDDYFVTPPTKNYPPNTFLCYLFLIPSYNIDTALTPFLSHLDETYNDFRIDHAPLSGLLGYSVFGFGDREGWPTEEEGFCFQAKEIDRWMAKLTKRKRIYPMGMGDVKSDGEVRMKEWWNGVCDTLDAIDETGNLGEGVPGSGNAAESDDENTGGEDNREEDTSRTKSKKLSKKRIDDMEDLGGIAKSAPLPIDFTTSNTNSGDVMAQEPKAMVPFNSPTYKSLTKQGYSIIGTHSGVKLCRWTKSALRGRGSCYKYSFYGIASHRCMEATPSLSCSNKCVFCWRHGTNPVGTTWRWSVDQPDEIYDGIKAAHYEKIKVMRGVPGVRADRYSEAMDIKHCALSLVGEPLFYPHINQLLARLHGDHISTFLVCNAQHPSHLRALDKVTQLYVSIDAANPESLKRIDRPLHRDYWERFMECLDILREKRDAQRTVFRLTLVKGFDVEEAAEYAALVTRAQPGFIEIKGVTFCGTTTAVGAGLSMENVPFWEEVVSFATALNRQLSKEGLKYGVAAEHAHSCCILLAKEEYQDPRTGNWRTWIDYSKFFRLLEQKQQSGNDFGPLDYVGSETPHWAAEGMGGFDPRDTRVYRKGKNKKPLPEGMDGLMRHVDDKQS